MYGMVEKAVSMMVKLGTWEVDSPLTSCVTWSGNIYGSVLTFPHPYSGVKTSTYFAVLLFDFYEVLHGECLAHSCPGPGVGEIW